MFPPTKTRTALPRNSCSARRNRAVSVVVVVFPSLPVIPSTRAGVSSRNSSISEVTYAPCRTASRNSGRSGRSPGERKITRSSRSSRYCSPRRRVTPAASSRAAVSPNSSRLLRSRATTVAPCASRKSISGRLEIPSPTTAKGPGRLSLILRGSSKILFLSERDLRASPAGISRGFFMACVCLHPLILYSFSVPLAIETCKFFCFSAKKAEIPFSNRLFSVIIR